MIHVVSSSRSDESKYVVVPNFAIWYLKIIASNKYTLKDSRYGDVSVVSFCYDGNYKSKLDLETMLLLRRKIPSIKKQYI